MKVVTAQRALWKRSIMLMLTFLLVLSSTLPVIGGPLTVQAATNTFYVSATGDDTADGSEDAPFATLGKAYNSAPTDGTIILLSDITLSAALGLNINKKVTIQSKDSGDKKTIFRDTTFSTNRLIHVRNGTITFKNLIIDGNNVEITKDQAGVLVGDNAGGNKTAIFENVEITKHLISLGLLERTN